MQKASDNLLLKRTKVNAMLHIPKNLSYKLFPMTLFHGRVSMHEVRTMLKRAARNGAEWNGGELIRADEIGGISNRSMFRVLKVAPHFRVSNKLALVNQTELLKAAIKKGKDND